MFDRISAIDLSIIGLYFMLVAYIGYRVSRQTKTGEDLFLGGRSFGWGLIGLSLFASNISASTLVGLSGRAYSSGIADSVYEWMSGIPLIIAAAIFIPLYLKSRITTIPQFLELRYDRRSRLAFSGLTIATSVLIEMPGGVYAGGLVLQVLFPGLPLWITCLALTVVAGLYTAAGGLKAVVYTDTIQAVILIVGCLALTMSMFAEFNYDWGEVMTMVNEVKGEQHLSVVKPADDETLPWTGLIFAVPFLGFWYWTTNQYIVQRVLGAKDLKHARWGVMLAGFLKVVPLFIMVIPGVLAIKLLPGIANSDHVIPQAIINLLPIGLIGLVLAGLISAILSSVDSALNSASTLVVKDFLENEDNPDQLSEAQKVRYGRITTFVLMVVAALVAPFIQYFEGLWGYLQSAFGIIAAPVVVLFLVGVFFKRGNGAGAFHSLLWGTLGGMLLFALAEFTDLVNIHYTSRVGIMVAITTLIFVLVSRFTPQADKDISEYVFRRELLSSGHDEPVPFYVDWRWQAFGLLVLIGVLLVMWW